ncbi:hypothetical protein PMAYCL1PPCAC_05062, partial [Pristionchus mayeri]
TGSGGGYNIIKKFNSPDGSLSIAVKKMTTPFVSKDRAALVLRELNLLKSLQLNGHRNIVRLIGMYTVDETARDIQSVYHITEHCGSPLSTLIANPEYSMGSVKKWIKELLSALQHIHSMG